MTIAINGFSNDFFILLPSLSMVFNGFSDHWPNDAMVSMEHCGLVETLRCGGVRMSEKAESGNDNVKSSCRLKLENP